MATAADAILHGLRAPAVSIVDEILNGSRSLATVCHDAADTVIDIMVETFMVSLNIIGALTKVSIVGLFFAFISYTGYEISFHTTASPLLLLAAVIVLAGALPLVGGFILGVIVFLEALFYKRQPPGRQHPNPWVVFLFGDLWFVLVVQAMRASGISMYSPLLASTESLVVSLVKVFH